MRQYSHYAGADLSASAARTMSSTSSSSSSATSSSKKSASAFLFSSIFFLSSSTRTTHALRVNVPGCTVRNETFLFDAGTPFYTYTVPACATFLLVEAAGARGGDGTADPDETYFPGLPGRGGILEESYLPVSAGETLFVYVGGAGPDLSGDGDIHPGGYNGGGRGGWLVGSGGGGASDIRRGGHALEDRILVAGGGGGAGAAFCVTGDGAGGGGLWGGNATDCADTISGLPGIGGGGAFPFKGGAGGEVPRGDYSVEPGQLGLGANAQQQYGGGGGGGYYGGGGGGAKGGGGGSSYSIGTDTAHFPNVNYGDGYVIIHYICDCTDAPTVSPTISPTPDRNNVPSTLFTIPPVPDTNNAPTLSFCVENVTVFTYNDFFVPYEFEDACTTEIQMEVYGARGSMPQPSVQYGEGGLGAQISATVPYTPGEKLYVFVGGAGEDVDGDYSKGGFNGGGAGGFFSGGGGGGASDVRKGGYDVADRVIVAAGGGGNGAYFCPGKNGGYGGDHIIGGEDAERCAFSPYYNGEGGHGGEPAQGGEGSDRSDSWTYDGGLLAASDGNQQFGGGGGGGFYAGSGGSSVGGGGGASHVSLSLNATNVMVVPEVHSDNGIVVFRFCGCSNFGAQRVATPDPGFYDARPQPQGRVIEYTAMRHAAPNPAERAAEMQKFGTSLKWINGQKISGSSSSINIGDSSAGGSGDGATFDFYALVGGIAGACALLGFMAFSYLRSPNAAAYHTGKRPSPTSSSSSSSSSSMFFSSENMTASAGTKKNDDGVLMGEMTLRSPSADGHATA